MHNPAKFIGFTLVKDFRDEIVRAQSACIDKNEFKKPLEPHLTLLSPSDIRDKKIPDLVHLMNELSGYFSTIEAHCHPLQIVAGRVLLIPVFSRELHRLHEHLISQNAIDRHRQTNVGETDFKPHITLLQATEKNPELLNEAYERIKSGIEYRPVTLLADIALFVQTAPRTYRVEHQLTLTD